MLDIKFIRENKALVQKAAEDKRFKVDLDKLLELDDKLKVQKNDLEVLQAERNTLSKKIGKASSNEEREQLKAKVSEFKPKMAELETVVKDLEAKFTKSFSEFLIQRVKTFQWGRTTPTTFR